MAEKTKNDCYNSKDDIILAQWQTCVEMADSISQRRDTMNNLFVTLNLAFISLIVSLKFDFVFLLCAIGVGVCIFWIALIKNFRNLNIAKFQVILEMEKQLPFQAFDDEWKIAKNQKKYIEQTEIEKLLPILFILAYLVLIIFSIVNLFGNLKCCFCN